MVTFRHGVFLCMISPGDAVWDVDFIIIKVRVCVRAYLRKLGSIWASSWMSSASLWAILMANSLSLLSCSNMACVWVSSSWSNASCISSSAWNNIHSHKSIIRTHNLNTLGVYHTCAFVLLQLDGNTQRHKNSNGSRGGANSNDHIFELKVLNCGGPNNPNEADIIPVFFFFKAFGCLFSAVLKQKRVCGPVSLHRYWLISFI